METFNVYNLQDDVLFKSNDSFYEFVTQVCGKVEADILRVQGIRNVHSLIRSNNLLAVLEFDCDEVNALKPYACFECKDGSFIIRQDVKLNLEYLFEMLKNKHEKYRKKYHQQQRQHESMILVSSTTALNIDQNNIATIQNSTEETTTTSLTSPRTPTLTNTPNPSPSNSKYLLVNDHVIFIQELIEKYSSKIFMSVVLKRNEHYELFIKQNNEKFSAMIKCKCGTKLTLPVRTETSTFILSNYYAHLTMSNCSMVDRILKEEKLSNSRELEASPTPASSQSSIDVSNAKNTNTNESKRKHDDSSKNQSSNTKTKKKETKFSYMHLNRLYFIEPFVSFKCNRCIFE